MKTAAIIIIGNEILSGKIQDTNSSYLAAELRELGVDVRRITVIPDDIDIIGEELAASSATYDFVFTAGGVGPTHDDVTMAGIAKGLGLGMTVSQRLLDIITSRCGGEVNDFAAKMALLPEGAELIEAEGLGFPTVAIRNVYVFPGIPEFLVKKFSAIKERFRSKPFMLRRVYVNEEECYIAGHLDEVAGTFADVIVGSYPKVGRKDYKVVVTLESQDGDSLARAVDMLLGLLSKDVVTKTE